MLVLTGEPQRYNDTANIMKPLKLLAFLISSALLITTLPAEARIKCWTNKDGFRECGDKIPPEYSQKKHEVLNKQGLVVDKEERAKTEEELVEEKRLAAEQAAEQAEQDRIAAEKHNEDSVLLKTFSSVEDIETARDDKITVIEGAISLAERRNEKIQQDLGKHISQAATDERVGREPAETLLNDIEQLQRQIRVNNNFIKTKRGEQETVRKAYSRDIKRFNELKSASSK